MTKKVKKWSERKAKKKKKWGGMFQYPREGKFY